MIHIVVYDVIVARRRLDHSMFSLNSILGHTNFCLKLLVLLLAILIYFGSGILFARCIRRPGRSQ